MQEGIFLVANVDESRIQAWHQTLDPTQKDVTYGEVFVGLLIVKFHQLTILEKGDIHIRR